MSGLTCAAPDCQRAIGAEEPHVRQARLDAEGIPRKGEFDAFHLACHFRQGDREAQAVIPAKEPAPGQEELF